MRNKWRVNLQGLLPLTIKVYRKLQHRATRFHFHLEVQAFPNLPVPVCIYRKLVERRVYLADDLSFHLDVFVSALRRIFSITLQENYRKSIARQLAPDFPAPIQFDGLCVANVFILHKVSVYLSPFRSHRDVLTARMYQCI